MVRSILYYETLGSADDPTLMMINGGGSQCIAFDEAWCQRFVDRGLWVLRFDNRDVGLSTHLTDADRLARRVLPAVGHGRRRCCGP